MQDRFDRVYEGTKSKKKNQNETVEMGVGVSS